MKTVNFLKALGGVVAVVVACNTYAQSSDAGTTMAPAATTNTKAVKKANRQLGHKVRAAIGKVQGVDVSNIAVRARGGDVTLTGSVPTQDQIDKAGDAAKGVAGVTSVTNKLSVVQQ